jgi:FkbM family methyltransferase
MEDSSITVVEGRHGSFATFTADPTIGEAMRRYGEWAESEIALLSSLLRPGDVMLDVGSFIGTHAIALAPCVAPQGYVIAIEAQPEVHALLCFNVVRNGLSGQVKTINAVMSDKPGELRFARCAGLARNDAGARSFLPDFADQPNTDDPIFVTTLPVMTIDALGLARCNLIKLDVEAMESIVLRGALETIRRHRPVIYFEQVHDRMEQIVGTIFPVLAEVGYRLHWHVSNPFNRRNFRAETVNIFGGAVETNVLCLFNRAAPAGLTEIRSGADRPVVPSLSEAIGGCAV